MELVKFSESGIDALVSAHSSFLGSVADVGKAQQGYGYKYADLAQILAASRGALEANGLSLTQFPTFTMYPVDQRMVLPADSKGFAPELIGEVVIVTTLAHSSGQFMQGQLSIPVETMKNLSVAQAVGAAISYARRYHASSILGIASEDNDAARSQDNSPSSPPQNRQPARQPAKPAAKPAGPVAPPVVSEEQADALRARIEAMGRDAGKFATAVSGVPTLNRLPANAYDAACRMLTKAETKQAEAQVGAKAETGDPGAHADPSADAQAEDAGPDEGDQVASKVA